MATRIILVATLLILVCAPVHAQTRKEQSVTITSAASSGSTTAGDTQVTFIFSASFTGTVKGVAFTASDAPLIIHASYVNFLAAIPYTVTAGTVRIVEVR